MVKSLLEGCQVIRWFHFFRHVSPPSYDDILHHYGVIVKAFQLFLNQVELQIASRYTAADRAAAAEVNGSNNAIKKEVGIDFRMGVGPCFI